MTAPRRGVGAGSARRRHEVGAGSARVGAGYPRGRREVSAGRRGVGAASARRRRAVSAPSAQGRRGVGTGSARHRRGVGARSARGRHEDGAGSARGRCGVGAGSARGRRWVGASSARGRREVGAGSARGRRGVGAGSRTTVVVQNESCGAELQSLGSSPSSDILRNKVVPFPETGKSHCCRPNYLTKLVTCRGKGLSRTLSSWTLVSDTEQLISTNVFVRFEFNALIMSQILIAAQLEEMWD
jgi:hypothetical protein